MMEDIVFVESRPAAPIRVVGVAEVLARTRMSRSTLYRLIAEGRFPKQAKLSERTVCWSEAVVNEWIAARLEAAR